MLTARSAEIDRVMGLETGADDYLTKLFSVREFVARARATIEYKVPLDKTNDLIAFDGSSTINRTAGSLRDAIWRATTFLR